MYFLIETDSIFVIALSPFLLVLCSAFTGEYVNVTDDGTFLCVVCDNVLFQLVIILLCQSRKMHDYIIIFDIQL